MKNTCKILGILLIILIALSNAVYALVEDTEPPVLNSITMSTKSVKPGDTIQFSVNTTDNLSGTYMLSIVWGLEGTSGENEPENRLSKIFGGSTTNGITSDVFEGSFTIPNKALPGNWQTKSISIHDLEGNYKTIWRDYSDEFDVSTLDFTIEKSDNIVDREAPQLKSVKIIDASGEEPGTVIIEADISDNVSEKVMASVNYATQLPKKLDSSNVVNGAWYSEPNGYSVGYSLVKQDSGKYQANISLVNKYVSLILIEINLLDEAGNSVHYTYHENELKEVYGNLNYVYLDTNLDIIPSNYEKDESAPILGDVSHNKTKIITPGLLETTFDIKDEESGFCEGIAYYKNEDGSYNVGKGIRPYPIDSDGKIIKDKYVSKVEFSRYENPGKIHLYKVVLGDKAGNNKTYSIEDGTLEKQEIEVVSDDTKYTLETSNIVTNYIEQISKLPEGSTVLCSITSNKIIKKELFDAIKGKDIKITFEDVYGQTYDSKGIQWIINGKDIKNETKDIDMNVNMSVEWYCPYYLETYEFPEIIIEESLTQEEAQNKWFKEGTKVLTDYFNYLKTLGYKHTDKYMKKSIEYFNEGFCDIAAAILEGTWYTKYLSIDFADNGLLPGNFVVRIKPEYATRNIFGAKGLFLFYMDGDKFTQVMENIFLTADDYYELNISHNSEYALSKEAFREAEMENEQDIVDEKVEEKDEQIVEQGKEQEKEHILDEQPKTGFMDIKLLIGIGLILMVVWIGKNKVKKRGKTNEKNM